MNKYGFIKVAAASPQVVVGDVAANTQAIIDTLTQLKQEGVQIAVFPELCITGYTCGDLFRQHILLQEARQALEVLRPHTQGILTYVGLPLRGNNGALYNCAVLLNGNEPLRVYPKRYLPNYSEYYEKRWFAPYRGEEGLFTGMNDGDLVRLSAIPEAIIGCEICEDLWVPLSPSTEQALAGANLIVNLSAGNEVIGKAEYRRELVRMNSAKNLCGYIYASAGMGESTQDMVFSGHSIIAENGTLLAEKRPFETACNYIVSEIDIERLNSERMRMDTFTEASEAITPYTWSEATLTVNTGTPLTRPIAGHPFVPSNATDRSQRAKEITQMQAWGLVKRLQHTHIQKVVVGISGGLDSTLALLVVCQAYDILGWDRQQILGITMPGFGTTGRTYENAKNLVRECGATLLEIPIKDAATQHLHDLKHPLDLYDITYENAQARERTQVLFDVANRDGALVIGTGDLSELALGWCTYNGDQMSNYGVNASIPKTLVRYLVQYYADEQFASNATLVATLKDIIDTPVSPELLPPDKDGNIAQKTENSIGSYLLHDFILYYVLRYGFTPSKIYYLAQTAIAQGTLEHFSDAVLKDTLRTFYRRFFQQQFKRSCMPDGVKVGTICLSPRGDWRMPSDASANAWLKQVEQL